MSNLNLPFKQTGSYGGYLFEIENAADGTAIHGLAPNAGTGVYGMGYGTDPQSGDTGTGVRGDTDTGTGVQGNATKGMGVTGVSDSGIGVLGQSNTADAVKGVSYSPQNAGVSAENRSNLGNGYGIWAKSTVGIGIYATGGQLAGKFDGNVEVTGDVVFVNPGGDCAEDFDVEDSKEPITPGIVLVIGDEGRLTVSREAYDSRIAGVVSGAGNLRPAILLNRINSGQHRVPIALVGKAFCRVDATSAPIKPGDLLTTAATPGYAMKVLDHTRAVGAILGKALEGLEKGQGLIQILVTPR